MMAESLIVPQQHRRAVDLREHHVEVAVDVRVRRATSDDGLEQIFAGLRRRHGYEAGAFGRTAVPKQLRGLAIRLALLKLGNLFLEVTVGGQHIEAAIKVV